MSRTDRLRIADDLVVEPDVAFQAGAGVPVNVHALFHQVRANRSVLPNEELIELAGLDPTSPVVALLAGPGLSVVSHGAVAQVLRDPQTFSSSAYAKGIGKFMGPNHYRDGCPDHQVSCHAVNGPFNTKSMPGWAESVIRPIVHRYVDRLGNAVCFDLVEKLALPFPGTRDCFHARSPRGGPASFSPPRHRGDRRRCSTGAGQSRRASAWHVLRRDPANERETSADDLISVLVSLTPGHRRSAMPRSSVSCCSCSRQERRVAPLQAERLEGLPSTCIVVAGYDVLRDEVHAYAQKLRAAGVSVKVQDEASPIHGFWSIPIPLANTSMASAASSLAKALSDT